MEPNRSKAENEGSPPLEETAAPQRVNEQEEPGTSASQSGQPHAESIDFAWLLNPTESSAPAMNTTTDPMQQRDPTQNMSQQEHLPSPVDYLNEMVGRLPPPRRNNDWNMPQNPTPTGPGTYFVVPPQREVRSEQPPLPPFGFRPPLPRDWPRAPRVSRTLRTATPSDLLGVQGSGCNPTEPSRMHNRHPWERTTTRYQYGRDCPWGCTLRCGHEPSARSYARNFPESPARIVRPQVETDPYLSLPPWRREERPPIASRRELPPPRSISVPNPRRYTGPSDPRQPEETPPNILCPEELQTNAPHPEGRPMAERSQVQESSSTMRQPIQAGIGVQQMDILHPQNPRMEVPRLGEPEARPEAPRMEVTQRRYEVSFTTSEVPQLEVHLSQNRRMIISVPLAGETEQQHSEEPRPESPLIEFRRPVLGQLHDIRSERQIRQATRNLGRRIAPRLLGRRIVGRSEFRQLVTHSEETRPQDQRMDVPSQFQQAEVHHPTEQRAVELRQDRLQMELHSLGLQHGGLLQPQGQRAEEPRQEGRQMELICPELQQSGVLQPQEQRAEEPQQEGRQIGFPLPELQRSGVLQPQGQRADELISQEIQRTEFLLSNVQREEPCAAGSWRIREPESETQQQQPEAPWQVYEFRKSKSQQLRRQAQLRQAQMRQAQMRQALIRQAQQSEPPQSQNRRARRAGLQAKQSAQPATKAAEIAKPNEMESVPVLEFFDARSTDSVTEDEYASASSAASTARGEEDTNVLEATATGSEPSMENVLTATQSIPGFASTSSSGLSITTSQIDLSSDSDESL